VLVLINNGDSNGSDNGSVNDNGDGSDDHDEESILRTKLENGVETSEGTHYAKLVSVETIDMGQSQLILENHFKSREEQGMDEREQRILDVAQSFGISDGSEDDTDGDDKDVKERKQEQLLNVRLVVQEGKYRMVRRMLANCGHPVVELKRESHGIVQLNDLEIGKFRDCTEEELEWANGLLSGKNTKN
jgi:pseudouridine synthase